MFPVAFKGQLEENLSKGFVIKRSIFRKCLGACIQWKNGTLKANASTASTAS